MGNTGNNPVNKTRRWKMKKLVSLVAMVALILGFWLPEAGAQKVVKIGALLTTSGAAAHLGKTALNGALFAVEDLNAKGGITVAGQKYKVELINYDDKCVAKDAVSATERLLRQDKVPVILGALSGSALRWVARSFLTRARPMG
jgi:branched-chain amino acid transport system substrate-binding protein